MMLSIMIIVLSGVMITLYYKGFFLKKQSIVTNQNNQIQQTVSNTKNNKIESTSSIDDNLLHSMKPDERESRSPIVSSSVIPTKKVSDGANTSKKTIIADEKEEVGDTKDSDGLSHKINGEDKTPSLSKQPIVKIKDNENKKQKKEIKAKTSESPNPKKNVKEDVDTKNTSQERKGTSEEKNTCTISIRCDTILQNKKELTSSKEKYVPSDGCILGATEVTFEDNETVFDVLKRVCKENKIQIEFSWTPMYDSYYIEGIHQLYEFDCGSQSGWMYKVNDWFPNYGCSSYKLKKGDNIQWQYTCKGLGEDIGASLN